MKKLFSLAFFTMVMAMSAIGQNIVTIESRPGAILIEQGKDKQIVNFDFLVTNSSSDTLFLDKLSVSVYDSQNNLLHSSFLDNNGTTPSIAIIPNRSWEGATTQLIFNPFPEFGIASPIHRLEYEWVFLNNADEEFILKSSIHPKVYTQKNKLSFPLKGKALVYDAHDYNSHHRRFDYTFGPIKAFGINSNFMRYAYDFVILNNENKQYKNKGETDEEYFGYGNPVYAVARGKVVYASATHKDDKRFDVTKLKENPLELYGNCIAIQHADGAISIYGHLKENSINVKLGDSVNANQEIAQIGVSGSSFFPHLHFEMRTSLTHSAEGLPSYFENITLLEGNHKRKLATGLVETGNIIEVK